MKSLKIAKRISIALVIMLVMAFMPSCQSANKPGGQSNEGGPGFEKYKTPVTVSVYFSQDGTVTFPNGETWDNNVWTDAYFEELGIKIKSAGVTTAEGYNSKMAMLMSANALPDVFQLDTPNLMSFQISDKLADLTPYFDEYTSEIAKHYLNYDGGIAIEQCKTDGKLYGVPKLSTLYDDAVNNIAIRTDWLDNLGIPEPETWDDILNIIEAFATQDPDNNGKNDTYGLAVDNCAVDGILRGVADLQGFFNAYHAYPGRWVDDGEGGIEYGSIQPEMIKPLSVLADFYKKGYIDPEYYNKDRWQVKTDIGAGKIGLAFQVFWAPANWMNLQQTLGDKLKFYPIMSFDDKPVKLYYKNWWAQGTKMVVNKNFEHPEVLFKMLNLELKHGTDTSDEWLKYFSTEDGFPKHKYMIVSLQPAPDLYLNNYSQIKTFLSEGTPVDDVPSNLRTGYKRILDFINGDDMGEKAWGSYMSTGSKNSAYAVLDYYLSNNMVQIDKFTGIPTKTMWAKSSALQWQEIGSFNEIIRGNQPIDFFNTFVDDWNKLGGDKVVKEVKEWYNSQKKTNGASSN